MKQLRAGIIGLGVGEQHIRAYEEHPDCEVAAICDFDEQKLRDVGRRYPRARQALDPAEVIGDPDIHVVSIASHDNYHFEQVVEGIRNGKHLFVEKPLCLHEHEARRIRELLAAHPDIQLSSNLILRKCPRFQWLKGSIENGELGELFYVESAYNYGRIHKITEGWRGKLDFYSVVHGGAVHLVDLILWLTNDTVEEVKGYGNQIASRGSGFRYNDFVVSLLRFCSGLIATVTANFGCVFPHFHQLSVYGTKATFVNGLDEGLLFTSRDSRQAVRGIRDAYPGVLKGDLIRSFVDAILGRGRAEVTADEVFKVMSVCFAMERAAAEERAVPVNYI